MERSVLGLDLGGAAVKLAHVKAGKAGPELLGAAQVQMPEGAMSEIGVADADLVAGAIREALVEAGVRRRLLPVVTGIPGRHLAVRALTVPTMDHSELQEAVKWEAAQYLPYAVDEAVFDFVELGAGGSPGTLEVLSLATRRVVVEGFVHAIELAGLEPAALDALPLALGRVYFPEPEEFGMALGLREAAAADGGAEEASAIADVGATTTDVSIFRRGRLRVSRSIPLGGARFTGAVAERCSLNPAAAEELKLRSGRVAADGVPGEGPEALLAQALTGVAEELAEEIQRSLDYFRAQSHWLPVNRLRLTGDGARLAGLDRLLEEHLGLKVEPPEALPPIPAALAQAVASGQVSAGSLGLALWEVNRA
jgi:type IV pilus assembly protein PilM